MKAQAIQIEFVMKDKVEGKELTPSTISLSRFNQFNEQVERFIKGSENKKLDQVFVAVEEGSYKLRVLLSFTMLSGGLERDLRLMNREDTLGMIDPRRAEVVRDWQASIKKSMDLKYAIKAPGIGIKSIELSKETDYRDKDEERWVKIEKYLIGEVTDMGGAQKANIHIRLRDTSETLIIDAMPELLKEQEKNRLYHEVLIRVEALQNIKTGEIKKWRLISFEDHQAVYDEDAPK